MVSTGVSEDRARELTSMKKWFYRYYDLKRITKLGVTIRPDDLDFEKGLIFAWIAEGDSGRNN